MNIKYLKYAVEIAKSGSINKAAEQLYIAQPNLTRAIKELEKELSIIIFDRNAKGMTLTPDGEKLIQYGKRILKEIDDVEELFKDGENSKRKFSISVPRASYIGEAFSNFSLQIAKENNVEVLYKETNSSRTLKNLLEDGYNLGIIRYAEHYDKYYKQMLEEKGFNSELVTEFKYVLIVNKDSPLAKKKQLSFKDLDDYIEVAHGDPYVPSLVFSTVRKEEFQDSIKKRIFVFERASQFEILSKNLNAFMFVSPVPKSTLDRYGLVIKECEDNNKVYKDVMIYRKSYRLTKLDLDFISSLCEAKRMYM